MYVYKTDTLKKVYILTGDTALENGASLKRQIGAQYSH